jgi:Relaxase/Mobilisation nuclease domain
MLAKQFKGRNFHGCLAYVLGKEGATQIGGNVSRYNAATLNHEFTQVSLKRSHLSRSVYHCALSLAPGETLSNATWRDVARDYLTAMGFDNSQYILVQHTDTESHQHVHIVANRVAMDGKTVSDSFDHYRAQNVVRAIEESYNLRPVLPSWKSSRKALSLRQLKQEAETGIPSVQRLLQDGITEALQDSLSLPDLVDRLQQCNIKTYAFYGQKNRLQGLAYEMDGVVMSGTALGYSYQVGGLIQQLEQQNPGTSAITLHSLEQITRSCKTIIASIRGAAFDQPRLPELLDRLQNEGIETHIQFAKIGRYGKRAKQIQYRSGRIGFQASDLGKDYTLQGLEAIGIQYDPAIDDAKIDRQQRAENIMRVSIKDTMFDESSRDRSLERLMQLLQQLAAEAREKNYDRLEVFSTLELGIQQWLAIAALHLREQQDITTKPKITVAVLAGNNEESTIAALRQAADRVIENDRELNTARHTKTIVLEPELERAKTIEQMTV